MRCLTLAMLLMLTSLGGAATRVAEVLAVEAGGWMEVRHLGPSGAWPARLRFPLDQPPPSRPGKFIRLRAKAYGEDWWLEESWPLEPPWARALADREWWREQRREPASAGPPWRGLLGFDAAGRAVQWSGEAFVHGFLLVPFCPEAGAREGPPAPLRQAARLHQHLALTAHRDLPWVFWSMQPAHDAVERCKAWEASLGLGREAKVHWVSSGEEFVPAWQRWLGVPQFEVDGQPPQGTPQLIVVDPAGEVAARYEGWSWPLERLEQVLDASILDP